MYLTGPLRAGPLVNTAFVTRRGERETHRWWFHTFVLVGCVVDTRYNEKGLDAAAWATVDRTLAGIAHLEAVDIWPDLAFYSDDHGDQARMAVKKAAAIDTVLMHMPMTREKVAVRFADDLEGEEGGSDGDVSAMCWKHSAR